MVRSVALLTGMILALGVCGAVRAQSRLEYPRPCPNVCVPNVANFGYFRTTWRQWPGEQRLEQVNPRAVGAEILPTPGGQEQLPLPRGATAPGAVPPQPPSSAPEGGILPPPGGTILPPERPSVPSTMPEPPAEPKPVKPSKSSTEGKLPGLPVESDQAPIPGPFDNGQAPSPTPNINPPSVPAAKDATKANEGVKSEEKSPPKEEKKAEEKLPSKEGTKTKDKPQPKEEIKSKTEPKPKDSPKTLKDDMPSSETYRENTKPTAGTAMPFDQHNMQHATVVSLAVEGHVEGNGASPGEYRANSISTASEELAKDTIAPAAYATAESPAQYESTDEKAAVLPVAFNGCCPVELIHNGRWTAGDVQCEVVHKGWIYRLSGIAQREQFLANPDVFTPTYCGNDPVLAIDEQRAVPGQVSCCATYNGRLYMFSGAATQAQFNRNPQRYAVR